MELEATRKALVAVDLGAQSCRVSLLRWNHGEPTIEVIHRFSNAPLATADGLRWDVEGIFRGVKTGLRLCAAQASEGIASVGVDGWGVDYVRLNEQGGPAANPFCYRDARTERAEKDVHAILPPARLYSLTGIQILRINTLYQLYADKTAGAEPSVAWLNVPEFMIYRLGGKRVGEYTNATHTGLVRLGTHEWCEEIFQELGLDVAAAPSIVACGSIVGEITGDLAELPAFRGTKLIVPACHDTASAIAAIPTVGDDWGFISSGTWSLVGTVLDSPCATGDAHALNFTNLGGIGGKICFLKNVNGMWLLQQCMEEWEQHGSRWSLQDLLLRCTLLPSPGALIDVDDPQLMLPGNTISKMNDQLERLGQQKFTLSDSDVPSIANTIFHSLAARYAEVLSSISRITGRKLKRLFIVGGGSQNTLLNRLTAERTGLEVILGSTESTTVGSFAIQLAALESDWNPSTGVSVASVAKWAEQMAGRSLVLSTDRITN
jgi:rhamnulokinase